MARRASLFQLIRSTGLPNLIIAGPDEFLTDTNTDATAITTLPSEEDARRAVAAHTLLAVDAGWLSPAAANWMKKYTGKTPPGYTPVKDAPVTVIKKSQGKSIGIVFFPRATEKNSVPTPAQLAGVLEAGRAIQGKVSLVIGVSPWGQGVEKAFLPKAEGVYSCILGGGAGIAVASSLHDDAPSVLWIRPDMKGRATSVLQITSLPDKGQPMHWVEGKTFTAAMEFLDDRFPPIPAMVEIIGEEAVR